MGDMHEEDRYRDVFSSRYCSKSPLMTILSERNKAETWRRLWCWLAQGQQELGIPQITKEKVAAMYAGIENIDWAFQRRKESEMRHDVMSHIAAFEEAVPEAKGIVHLGATSAYAQDNADVLVTRDALNHLIPKLVDVLRKLGAFASAEAATPTVGLTHLQPATLTTVGKRAAMWAQDLLIAAKELVAFRASLRLRGIQGATGSRASFLALFDGDRAKVKALNARIVELATAGAGKELGCFNITGQTYSRMEDARLLNAVALVGSAVHRFGSDVRILQSRGEMMEGFGATQVGSSAMPYKRNPMKCERLCSLARVLISLPPNALHTAAVQGFERTLDDSANRRIVLSEAFLGLEALLTTLQSVAGDLRLLRPRTARNVKEELPFLALEPVLMALTQAGRGRQEAHEKIREVALAAHARREAGETVQLGAMLAGDAFFDPVRERLEKLSTDPEAMIGDAPNQVAEFVADELGVFLKQFEGVKAETLALTV